MYIQINTLSCLLIHGYIYLRGDIDIKNRYLTQSTSIMSTKRTLNCKTVTAAPVDSTSIWISRNYQFLSLPDRSGEKSSSFTCVLRGIGLSSAVSNVEPSRCGREAAKFERILDML